MVAASRSRPGASILQLPPTQCPLVFPQTGTKHWGPLHYSLIICFLLVKIVGRFLILACWWMTFVAKDASLYRLIVLGFELGGGVLCDSHSAMALPSKNSYRQYVNK